MEIKFFRRLRKFLRTTLFGGFVALAPLTLIILMFRWVINIIGRNLTPLVDSDPSGFRSQSLHQVCALCDYLHCHPGIFLHHRACCAHQVLSFFEQGRGPLPIEDSRLQTGQGDGAAVFRKESLLLPGGGPGGYL